MHCALWMLLNLSHEEIWSLTIKIVGFIMFLASCHLFVGCFPSRVALIEQRFDVVCCDRFRKLIQ